MGINLLFIFNYTEKGKTYEEELYELRHERSLSRL